MSNNSIIQFLRKHFSKRFLKALKERNFESAGELVREYQERFLKYMEEADFGNNNEKFSSYLNIYSGLAAYELLQENGFSREESVSIYDYMCAPLRKVAAISYCIADLLPNGFEISVNSLKEDMIGAKAVCWETSVLEDTEDRFEYRITKCLYFDTCKEHGYPEFTKVFCNHDRHAYDVLHRHAKFIRYAAIGEGGSCCHDAFVNVGKQRKAREEYLQNK